MRVIFISFHRATHISGVKYLHSFLRSKGYDSSILLFSDNEPNNTGAAVEYIVERKPEALCFSIMSSDVQKANDLAAALKARLPNCAIIFGGIHATISPESCLPVADVVVRGEGEEILVELLETLKSSGNGDFKKVNGIVLQQQRQIFSSGIRQPVQDLDGLPYPGHIPDFMYVTYRGKVRSISEPAMRRRFAPYQGSLLYVFSSRGCPFSCNFCSNSALTALYGKSKVRLRSVDSVLDEISREISNYRGILYVLFQDDCFMLHSTEWIRDFSEKYEKLIGLPFFIKATPNFINRERLAFLRKAGLRWISMGLQSGSDRVNRDIYARYITAGQFLEAAKLISEAKIFYQCDLIVDNPYETEADRMQTIDVLSRLPRPLFLRQLSLKFLVGTELLRMATKDRLSLPNKKDRMIRVYNSLSIIIPRALNKFLLRHRNTVMGRLMGMGFWFLGSLYAPIVYSWALFRTNDFRLLATLKMSVKYARRYSMFLFDTLSSAAHVGKW